MTIGYQAVYDESFLEAIRFAAEHGFDYVQFDLNVPHFFLHGMPPSERRAIRTAASEAGVCLSFHAPGDNVSLFTDFPGIREAIIGHFAEIVSVAEELGARHLTLHPGLHPSFRPSGAAPDSFMLRYADHYARVLGENLTELARSASRLLLCVENYGMGPAAMAGLEPLLGGDLPIYLTWDIAKAYGKPDVERFFAEHRESIREVHLHDAIPGVRSHLALGRGSPPGTGLTPLDGDRGAPPHSGLTPLDGDRGRLDFSEALPLVRSERVATTIEVRPREEAAASRITLLEMLRRR